MTPKYVKVHVVRHESVYCLSSVSTWTVSVLSFIMAGRLLFVILMYSCREIQVEARLPPTLIVNSPVITETDSVTLNCRAPSSVSVSQCYIYIVGRESPKILSCMKTLTGSELLIKAHQSSPAEVKVKCFYTVKQGQVDSPSPHSDTSSITIHRQNPQMSAHFDGEFILFTCSLPGSANNNTRCNLYFGEASHPVVTATVLHKKPSSTNQRFCQFTVTIGDLLRRLRLVQQSDASYDYSSGSDLNSQLCIAVSRTVGPLRYKPQMSLQHFDGDYVIFSCTLPGPADHDTKCNLYFGEATRPIVTGRVWKTRTSTNERFCQFTVTIDDLLRRLRLVQQSDASCDYTLGSELNSLSPRSDRYSLTDILKKESSTVPTRKPFTTTTDSVKRESSMASTRAPFTATKDLIDRPGASTTPVKPAEDIVEKQSDVMLSMPTSTVTTGLTDSKLHSSTPVLPTKKTPGVTAAGPSYTGSFISTSLTPVRPTSGQTPPKPGTNANSFPVTPPNSTSAETWTWKLVVAAACFGGVVFLGLVLLCAKRRTGRCSRKRTRANVSDDLMCMKNLDHGGSLPAGNDEAYSVITSVPVADCPAGSQKRNGQESQNEDLDVYHVYATVSEEPHPSALKDMVYSTLQAH
ncbi:uncharacterized protein LOC144459866 [Epinephelus lanceolatus]